MPVAVVCVAGWLVLGAAGCDEFGLFSSKAEVGAELRTLGVVAFQSAVTVDPDGAAPQGAERLSVEARFVRYDPPFEAEVRELLGLADLDALPAPDGCSEALRVRPVAAVTSSTPTPAGVEFLDVGTVLARGAGAEERLAMRTFPDLLDVISGVTYGGASILPFRPGSRYDVRGEADRSPWVSIGAPPGWADLRVGGAAVRDGLIGTFQPEPRLDLNWIPWADQVSDVVLSLFWTGTDGSPRGVVCHPADDGAFELPAQTLAELPPAPDVAGLTLRIERVTRVSFPMDSVEEAEAVFRVSLTTPVR
jgi:hypothetical protein